MKKAKKFLTALTASVLSVSMLSSFTASAENEAPQNSVVRNELESKLDEYMKSINYKKCSEKFTYLRCWCTAMKTDERLKNNLTYINNTDGNFTMYRCAIGSNDVFLYCEMAPGIVEKDIHNFIEENYAENERINLNQYYDPVRFGDDRQIVRVQIKGARVGNIQADIKGILNALKENDLIIHAEIEYGQISNGGEEQFTAPVSWFHSTSDIQHLSSIEIEDEYLSTNKDVIDYFVNNNTDCELGIIINKNKLPKEIQNINYEEIAENVFYNVGIDSSTLGYIPLTLEEASNLSEDIINAIEYFSAVPTENTFENQIDLLYEIGENVPIISIFAEHFDDNIPTIPVYGVIDALEAINGDANCDGKFTIADSTAILQALGNPDKYGLSLEGEYNADCSGSFDGVTAADAVFIQRKLAKGIE